jgi:hypothetical protein
MHYHLEHHRIDESEFFYDHLGMEEYDNLKERMWLHPRYKPWERSEMAAHFRAEEKRIAALRLGNSELGLVRVQGWD